MGCDIHLYVERRWNGRWVCVRQNPASACHRDYALFAKLAGVRGDGPEPRGLLSDISDSVRYWADKWKADAHSHSWLPLAEAVAVYQDWTRDFGKLTEMQEKWPGYAFFETEFNPQHDPTDIIENYRIVFWFDN